MNTTLIIRYDGDDVEIERERLGEDHYTVYQLVLEWLWKEGTGSVKVESFSSADVCTHCYLATPVE